MCRFTVGFRFNAQQLSRRVAIDLENGGHHCRVGDPEPVQQHRDGIHQHAAVVGDHLERGPKPGGVVRRMDAHAAFTGWTALAEPVVLGEHGGRHQRGGDGLLVRRGS